MKQSFSNLFLCAFLLVISPRTSAFLSTDDQTHFLGFIPVYIDIQPELENINSADSWNLKYLNEITQKLSLFQLVECQGQQSSAEFYKLFNKSLLNILFHINLKTVYGKDFRNKKKQTEEHKDFFLLMESLESQEGLKDASAKLFQESPSCKIVNNAYISSSQIIAAKGKVDRQITTTLVDWVKEHNLYIQASWQFFIWGSAACEWYFGYGDFVSHFMEYSKTYLRAIFSLAPIAVQLYHTHWRPLGPEELTQIALNLLAMSDISVKPLDQTTLGEKTHSENIYPRCFSVAPGRLQYERYLQAKKLLVGLVKSGLPTNSKPCLVQSPVKNQWPVEQTPKYEHAHISPPPVEYSPGQNFSQYPQQYYYGGSQQSSWPTQ